MKFIATKNQNKTADNHPDFRLYMKDEQGNMIEEEYTKKDGTKAMGWKSFGAMWHNVEGGKIKSSTISIEMEKLENKPEVSSQGYTEDQARAAMNAIANTPDDSDIRPEDIPF